jgi:hypothetical protein
VNALTDNCLPPSSAAPAGVLTRNNVTPASAREDGEDRGVGFHLRFYSSFVAGAPCSALLPLDLALEADEDVTASLHDDRQVLHRIAFSVVSKWHQNVTWA